jgi:hypothetical protein
LLFAIGIWIGSVHHTVLQLLPSQVLATNDLSFCIFSGFDPSKNVTMLQRIQPIMVQSSYQVSRASAISISTIQK